MSGGPFPHDHDDALPHRVTGAGEPPTADGWTPARLKAVRAQMRRYNDLGVVATCLDVSREAVDVALNDLIGRSAEDAYAAIVRREARAETIRAEAPRG